MGGGRLLLIVHFCELFLYEYIRASRTESMQGFACLVVSHVLLDEVG